MSKFKEAVERGKRVRRQQEAGAGEAALVMDFGAQAKAWLDEVLVPALEAARAEVAGEVNIDMETTPRPQTKAIAPSVRFKIYPKGRQQKTPIRTFTVSVPVSGEVSVSAPGMVAEDVGNIWERSDERFRNFLARQLEAAAMGN
ncbi:hypothetical protein [Mesorhizobium argentiipisi]|uniref:HK97 gp10 family phage protein n=1 Tax=Mesorhizobium argentiipisi TaxID=3015175 RepID=A0ABU8KFA3_9HYPH